jgi:hypothetical protein
MRGERDKVALVKAITTSIYFDLELDLIIWKDDDFYFYPTLPDNHRPPKLQLPRAEKW